MQTRKGNPYPIPDISSEGFWIQRGPVLGKNVAPNDRYWKAKVNVSDRLFAHHTLSSIRRDSRVIRYKEPKDALDYALSSLYVHSNDSMVPKMYVFTQPETLNLQTWRKLRNEEKLTEKITLGKEENDYDFEGSLFGRKSPPVLLSSQKPYMTTESSKEYSHKRNDTLDKKPRCATYASQMRAMERIHPSSLKLAIEGPHTDKTNPGYSRKTDGTFYCI